MSDLTWIEISKSSLENNILQLRKIIGKKTILCPCVKANAYGHGLIETSKIFLNAGADWLSVNSVYEAQALRSAGIKEPLYILGYVPLDCIKLAIELDCRLVVYNQGTLNAVSSACAKKGNTAKIHLKVETGTNRQGILYNDLKEFAQIARTFNNIEIEGLSTHFANIEDTTDHSYAELQLKRFADAASSLKDAGVDIPILHCANSAATILFEKTRFNMVRPGIACYGMWPSSETYDAYIHEIKNGFKLTPALTWKAKIAQVKSIPAGDPVGYGCTYKTEKDIKLAIIPVGYYDGYDRSITNGHVLINGQKAPVRGRVCMNIIMADITDIPDVGLEDEAVLMGRDGDKVITAEDFASWAGTINYEVTTRINERIPRVITE
jgi:alanine racemase